MPRVTEKPILIQVTGCLKTITWSGIGKVNLLEKEQLLSVIWSALVIHMIRFLSSRTFWGQCCILSNQEFLGSSWIDPNAGNVSTVECWANSHSRSTMIGLWNKYLSLHSLLAQPSLWSLVLSLLNPLDDRAPRHGSHLTYYLACFRGALLCHGQVEQVDCEGGEGVVVQCSAAPPALMPRYNPKLQKSSEKNSSDVISR